MNIVYFLSFTQFESIKVVNWFSTLQPGIDFYLFIEYMEINLKL